jgi:hypothetical protein
MLWFKKKDEPLRNPQLMAGQNDYVFRRSRTLTGSVSTSVNAGAQSRGQLKTDRLRLHELRAHMGQVLKLFFVVIVVCAALSFLVVNFVFSPDVEVGAGKHKPNLVTYQQTVMEYFGDHPFERFGFMLNPASLEGFMKAKHTELSGALVDRKWYGGDVRVALEFRRPLLTWQSGDKHFYVDGQGIAFTYNHYADPTLVLKDQSGLPTDDSGVVASMRFVRFLGRLVGAVDGYNMGKVTEVIIPASTREVDLKLEGREYIIRTNTDRDPGQEAEDIANTLAYLDAHSLKPQYVDVRVAHKAFYK